MIYDTIYNLLTQLTEKVYYKVIPDNYNFADILVIFILKDTSSTTYFLNSTTTKIYNLKVKIFHKSEETCIEYMNDIIDLLTTYKDSNIRKIELNYTDSLYDDLIDVNNIIIDMTITNDFE